MAPHLVASDLTILHHDKARTGKLALRGDNPLLQPRRSGDDLEGGTRLIGVIDTSVTPDLV